MLLFPRFGRAVHNSGLQVARIIHFRSFRLP